VGGPTVLIVDDNEFVRKLLIGVFNKKNVHAIQAQCSADAWREFQNNREDIKLVITDLNMDYDCSAGIKLAMKIRKAAPSVPIILFTPHLKIHRATNSMDQSVISSLNLQLMDKSECNLSAKIDQFIASANLSPPSNFVDRILSGVGRNQSGIPFRH
jgi:DNA-binding NtrC family response regulator